MLNVSDNARTSAFWSSALGYAPRPGRPEMLTPPDAAGPLLCLDQDDRTHLDLWTDSAEEQQTQVDRLIGMGATRVEWNYPPDADFVVLADPRAICSA